MEEIFKLLHRDVLRKILTKHSLKSLHRINQAEKDLSLITVIFFCTDKELLLRDNLGKARTL